MTDDLEERLTEALEQRGWVDAVEVHRVFDSVVLPGRRSASGGLARLVAVVLVGGLAVGALAVGLSNRGVGQAPAPSTDSGAPVSASVTDGTFALKITAEHGRYAAGDVIAVHTTLTYVGDPSHVTVAGSGSGLVVFSVEQPGKESVGGGMTMDCRRYDFVSGDAVDYPYTKSGGYDPGASGADFAERYLQDPLLHLPAGTWRIHAYFTGYIGTCSQATSHVLETSVPVVITDGSAVPSTDATVTASASIRAPLPDPAPFLSDSRIQECVGTGLPGVLSAFEVSHARDLFHYVPDFALAPEVRSDDPAVVVVYGGPVHTLIPGGSPGPKNDPEATLPPGRYDVCVVVGSPSAGHRRGFYSAVSFLDFDPTPDGFPPLP